MPYSLIKGSFHIFYPANPLSGPEPDGDTIKFQPDDKHLVELLPHTSSTAKFILRALRRYALKALMHWKPILKWREMFFTSNMTWRYRQGTPYLQKRVLERLLTLKTGLTKFNR